MSSAGTAEPHMVERGRMNGGYHMTEMQKNVQLLEDLSDNRTADPCFLPLFLLFGLGASNRASSTRTGVNNPFVGGRMSPAIRRGSPYAAPPVMQRPMYPRGQMPNQVMTRPPVYPSTMSPWMAPTNSFRRG